MSGFGKGLPESRNLQEKINKPFKPRLFQQDVLDRIGKDTRPLSFGRQRRYTGVDFGTEEGDKTMVTQATVHKGRIWVIVDEVGSIPDYKWYRNPIKWWKWYKLMRIINKHRPAFRTFSTEKTETNRFAELFDEEKDGRAK